MNYEKACNLLDIELYIDFDYKKLKHNYYIKALKYHPDKNNNVDAKKNFQNILDAYEFLKNYQNINECNNECNNEYSYINLLKQFMKVNEEKNVDIYKFLSIINNNYTRFSCDLLKQMPKSMLIKLHKFTNSYSDILYINKEILTEIDKLIYEYTKNDNNIILNPTIENLLNDEVYKLEYNNEIYYIPLWHHELIYDISNTSLIIDFEPKLPDYITLAQNNNIYINLSININKIINNKNLYFNIGYNKFNINVNELYIKKYQRYTIKNKGIPSINTNNIYDISNRSNVYVDINIIDIDN